MITVQSFEILRARVGLIFFTLAVTLVTTLVVSMLMPNKYTANTTFVVHYKETGLSNAILPQRLAESYLKTQINIINSPRVALMVVDRLNLDQDPDLVGDLDVDDPELIRQQLATVLLDNLEAQSSRESRMVNVNFTSEDPDVAAEIANAFTQAYIDTNLELSVNPAHRSAEWFNQELDRLRTQLQLAQEKFSAHQQKHGILTVDTNNDMDVIQLNELSRQLVEAQAQRDEAESRQREINKLIDGSGGFTVLPEVQSDGFIQRIKSELLQKETELLQLSSRLGRNHPDYRRVQDEIGNIHGKLNREIGQIGKGVILQVNKSVQLAKSHEQNLISEMKTQRSRLMSLKQRRDQMPALQQDVLITQKVYDSVLELYNESNLKSRLKMTNIAVLSVAVPPQKRSSPKLRLNLIVGLVLGIMLGIGFAFVAEMANPIIRSEQGLGEVLETPLIGYLQPGNYLTYPGDHEK